VCKNGGTCTHNNDGKTACICKAGYKGETCESKWKVTPFSTQKGALI